MSIGKLGLAEYKRCYLTQGVIYSWYSYAVRYTKFICPSKYAASF